MAFPHQTAPANSARNPTNHWPFTSEQMAVVPDVSDDIGANPNAWTVILLGALPPPENVDVTGVSPSPIGQDGGTALVAVGTFPVDEDLEVYLGFTGSAADPSCYGGQGYGMKPQSQNGTTLKLWAPKFSPGEKGSLKLAITYDGYTYVFDALVVLVERVYRSKQFALRGNFPGWMGLGHQLREKGRI